MHQKQEFYIFQNDWQKDNLLTLIWGPDIQKGLVRQFERITSFPRCKGFNFLLPDLQAEHSTVVQVNSSSEFQNWHIAKDYIVPWCECKHILHLHENKEGKTQRIQQCIFEPRYFRRNLHHCHPQLPQGNKAKIMSRQDTPKRGEWMNRTRVSHRLLAAACSLVCLSSSSSSPSWPPPSLRPPPPSSPPRSISARTKRRASGGNRAESTANEEDAQVESPHLWR